MYVGVGGCLQKSEEHVGSPGNGVLIVSVGNWTYRTAGNSLNCWSFSLASFDVSLSPPPRNIDSILLGQNSMNFEFKQVVTSRLEFEIFCWKIEKGHISQKWFLALSVLSSCFWKSKLKVDRHERKGLFSTIFGKKDLKCIGLWVTLSHCSIYQLEQIS